MNNYGWDCAPHPKRTLIRRLLIHGMCDFKDEIKTAVRELAERTFNGHLFKAYLLTVCAYSKTKHEPQRRRDIAQTALRQCQSPSRHSERSVGIP